VTTRNQTWFTILVKISPLEQSCSGREELIQKVIHIAIKMDSENIMCYSNFHKIQYNF